MVSAAKPSAPLLATSAPQTATGTGQRAAGSALLCFDADGQVGQAPWGFVATSTVTSVEGEPTAEASAALLDRVDEAWPSLAPDERLVFVLGYEACVALEPRNHRHRHDPRLGPAAFCWRGRVAPHGPADARAADKPSTKAAAPPALCLTVTAEAPGLHEARVRAAHAHLLDGVIYQANLAHPVAVAHVDSSGGLAFFRARTATRPPPCAALLDLPGWGSLISLTPERFVVGDLRAGVARTYPIKGTRPRDLDPTRDAAQLAALCGSEKDRAEHVMIVDLLRNDLGKVAVAGGVTVEKQLAPLTTPSVHHLETTIRADLMPGTQLSDVLRATVPGGSITGAPKSSAVDVIRALEAGPRGPYTGVLGVVDGEGRFATALLIRTWIRPDDGPGVLHVGGGIVVDSDPTDEWQETLHKARAFGEVTLEHAGEG